MEESYKMKANLERRLNSLRKAMAENGVGLAIYSHCPNFQYLTGLPPHWREGRDHLTAEEVLLIPEQGRPVLVMDNWPDISGSTVAADPLFESVPLPKLEQVLKDLISTANGDIAIGREIKGDLLPILHSLAGPRNLIPGWNLADKIRAVKDDFEIALLGKAAALTDEVIRLAIKDIHEGITMRELQLQIEWYGRSLGASGVSFPPVSGFIHATGEKTGSVISYGMDEGLRPGTTIFFDVGFVVDGYCSDWGRSVYFGDPDEKTVRAYAALNRAMIAAVNQIQPGTTRADQVFGMIEEDLETSGFADRLRARLPDRVVGHQIGVEVHENP